MLRTNICYASILSIGNLLFRTKQAIVELLRPNICFVLNKYSYASFQLTSVSYKMSIRAHLYEYKVLETV